MNPPADRSTVWDSACTLLGKVGLCDPSPIPTKSSEPAPALPGPSVHPWIPGNIKSAEQVVSEINDAHAARARIEAAIAATGDTPGLMTQAAAEVSKIWDSVKGAVAGAWEGAGETVAGGAKGLAKGVSDTLTAPLREVKQTAGYTAAGLGAVAIAALAVVIALGRR